MNPSCLLTTLLLMTTLSSCELTTSSWSMSESMKSGHRSIPSSSGHGMLYPRVSESRELKLLDGLWDFRVDDSPSRRRGFDEQWWERRLSQSGPVIDMPVPSSYNDITEDRKLRDFVGWAWYDTMFFAPASWQSQRVVLRFDSAHYYTQVWLNGQPIMDHVGGHLPFEADVSDVLTYGRPNMLTVALNNTLSPTTLPPGFIEYQDNPRYPPGYFVQNFQFDFFNYAGIHRHVRLYTTPRKVFIDDITVVSQLVGNIAKLTYTVVTGGGAPSHVNVSVIDAGGHEVAAASQLTGTLKVDKPHLWWPYGMNESVGYRYTLKVVVDGDVYRQPFGIRSVEVTANQILINKKPFYCLGVGKHEDSDIRGKGLDYALITKDFNMLRWLGVNCVRTSHYPYAEEILELADRQGVAIIDESPGVGIRDVTYFSNKSLAHHLSVMSEMVRRDKNKPCVIMWSVANEPSTNLEASVPYFKAVIQHTRDIDPAHRPVTFVTNQNFDKDLVIPYIDVICFNRYYSWYHDTGHLELIQRQLRWDLEGFRQRYSDKPIIMSEYGADSIVGLHREPSFVFTEEYQTDMLTEYHKEFDRARKEYLVGEMVWNFADFMTDEGVRRVVGNKKGLLTRQRQPKQAAFVIRKRYHSIAKGQDTDSCHTSPAAKYTVSPHVYGNY